MKKIIILFVGMLLLVGCSAQDKEKAVTCTISEQGVESTIEFTAEGDKVYASKTTFRINYDLFGVVDQNMKEQLKETYEATYTEMEGVVINVSNDGEEFLEMTIDVDYKTADRDYLVAAGLLEEVGDNSEYISLAQLLELNEEAGYTCAED